MHDTQPVQYMERTRLYYEAQGFEQAYQWACFDDVPFCQLKKPLAASRISVITTGARYDRKMSEPRFVDSGDVNALPARLFGDDLSWDKDATHLNDLGSYLPIKVLQEIAEEGVVGSVASRYHCVPTEYSQRRTREADAPEILHRCQEDQADIALLVPL